MLDVVESGELIVELLGREQPHHRLFGGRGAAGLSNLVHAVADVGPLRESVSSPHGREDDVAGGHEEAGDGVELRRGARVALAAVIPDERREGARTVGPVEEPDERQRAALEGHALFVEGRARLVGAEGCRDGERRRSEKRDEAGPSPHAAKYATARSCLSLACYISAIVATQSRLSAVDALRGAIMVIMAIDHTRDFIHAGAMSFSPEDLAKTTPLLFLTRWVTHICAPTFMFLAGIGASLRLDRGGDRAALSRFLLTRGLWLILLEATLMRLGMNFSFSFANPVLLLVLTALGVSMIALSGLIYLPRRVLLVLAVAIVLLHNSLDSIPAARFGAWAPLWNLLHQVGVFMVRGVPFVVGYPVLPWIGVMALGFCFGPVLSMEPARRRRVMLITGATLVLAFVAIRALNVYGDPQPWSTQRSTVFTVLSFLRATKYPPSLEFLLMTLGPALLALAYFDRTDSRWRDRLVVIGRVPMLFYVVHFWLLHVVASALAFLRYGRASGAFLFSPLPSMGGPATLFPKDFGYPLWAAYVVWIGVVVSLYPLCRWFAELKSRRREWWWSYL